MSKKEFEVTKRLESMRDYFLGDYKVILKHCLRIEKKLQLPKSMTSVPVTTETTAAPTPQTPPIYNYPEPTRPADYYEQMKLPTTSQQYYKLTIPIALTTFSIIDTIGFLLGSHKRSNDTKMNFASFFNGSHHNINNNKVCALNWLFRQGLSHSYFPKNNLGIAYLSSDKSKELFKNDGSYYLNVKYLIDIVIEILNEVIELSKTDSKINNRYLILKSEEERDYNDNKHLFL